MPRRKRGMKVSVSLPGIRFPACQPEMCRAEGRFGSPLLAMQIQEDAMANGTFCAVWVFRFFGRPAQRCRGRFEYRFGSTAEFTTRGKVSSLRPDEGRQSLTRRGSCCVRRQHPALARRGEPRGGIRVGKGQNGAVRHAGKSPFYSLSEKDRPRTVATFRAASQPLRLKWSQRVKVM
jgi:hypothetical protein